MGLSASPGDPHQVQTGQNHLPAPDTAYQQRLRMDEPRSQPRCLNVVTLAAEIKGAPATPGWFLLPPGPRGGR